MSQYDFSMSSSTASIIPEQGPVARAVDATNAHGDGTGGKIILESAEVQQSNTQNDGPKIIEEYPDGGRAWLVCLSVFLLHLGAWGCNLALSIYLSHYIATAEEFRDVPRSTVSLISGASMFLMLGMAPFSNYIEDLVGIRNCVALGAAINSIALYLTSLTTNITGLILTQAVLAGIGRGLVRMQHASESS